MLPQYRTERLTYTHPTYTSCAARAVVEGVKPSVPGWGAKAEDYQPLMDAAQVYFDSSDSKAGVTGDKVWMDGALICR